MNNALQIIGEQVLGKSAEKRLLMEFGGYGDADNTKAKERAHKYASSVMTAVKKTQGDKLGDLTTCAPQSIVDCMVDAAQLGVMIDRRQHAHLIKYGNTATLQIGYRGFIAKIKERHQDADVRAIPVYEGDEVTLESHDGVDSYTYKRKTAFPKESELEGVIASLSYTDDLGQPRQHVITMGIDDIKKIRGTAKTKFVWDAWFIEKAKVAAIKRLCKIVFAGSIVEKIIEYDNSHNHTMRDVTDSAVENVLDKLNAGINGEEAQAPDEPQEVEADALDADFTDITPPEEVSEVIEQNQEAAQSTLLPDDEPSTGEGSKAQQDAYYVKLCDKIFACKSLGALGELQEKRKEAVAKMETARPDLHTKIGAAFTTQKDVLVGGGNE